MDRRRSNCVCVPVCPTYVMHQRCVFICLCVCCCSMCGRICAGFFFYFWALRSTSLISPCMCQSTPMDAIVHLSIICIWVGRLFSSLQILNWMMQAQPQAEPQRGRLTSGLRPLIILSTRPDCLSLLLLKHGYIFSRRIVLEDMALKMQ